MFLFNLLCQYLNNVLAKRGVLLVLYIPDHETRLKLGWSELCLTMSSFFERKAANNSLSVYKKWLVPAELRCGNDHHFLSKILWQSFIYIYIYICVCVCVCIYIYIYIYIYIKAKCSRYRPGCGPEGG